MMGGPSQVRPIPRKYLKDRSYFTGFSPMRLFSIKSGDTLSSVDIEFTPSLDRSHLSNCFHSIGKSSKTLKSITLRGVLVNTTGIIGGLKLASSCINLDTFIYSVREEDELDGNPLEVIDSDHEPDIDEYYQQREDIREAGEEELLLDDLQFKSFPRYISITTDTILAQLELGNGKFFSKAEVLKLKTDQLLEGYSWIDHSGIALIMEVSKATLREFELLQPEEQYFPTRTAKKQELGTEEVPINLPELRDLRIKAEGMLEFDFSGKRVDTSIRIVAPLLTPERSEFGKNSTIITLKR